ncbi:MAG: hypothetical protein O3B04_09685 [Chloroflexi bacterium]|nr:hypothetical protein [Chloroflexota bacterium]MDA1298248.1 hypothetical protein [Chloroflexota bacterium]
MTQEAFDDHLPISHEEYETDLSVKRRRDYDPFYDTRAEMRGSPDLGERVCGYIASCWPEEVAITIAGLTAAQWEEWKRAHLDMYDRAYKIATAMLVAEIRASGLGMVPRGNQKSMAFQLAHMMKLDMTMFGGVRDAKAAAKEGSTAADDDIREIGGMTQQELAELAELGD